MKLIELRWTPYAVPFTAEFMTSHGRWSAREGIVLAILTGTGVTGIGEVVPLPSHGTARHADLLSVLDEIAPRLIGSEVASVVGLASDLLDGSGPLAPLRCGIEIAALAAEGSATEVSMARLLSTQPAPRVTVNTVVDATTCAASTAAAVMAVNRGFRSVKLKVGLADRPSDEVARVAAVREAIGPGIRLTLDANGAWTEQQAVEILLALEPYDISMVEQPVAAGDVSAIRRVRAAVGTPIAADESVTDIESVRALIRHCAVDAIVVKLPVVGGPCNAVEILEAAAQAGVAATVTSALDSGIGVTAALHVAATLPDPAAACGLATLELLEDDLIVEELVIRDGGMSVPAQPGLGVTLDEHALSILATGRERVLRC